ncbi:MAG: type II toxin-antitoxin system RelE family toxin [Thermoanaerobaculia bacterium]
MAGAETPAIEYKASVAKDLSRLDRAAALKIVGRVEKILATEGTAGIALKGEFSGLFRLRVGDHWVIYAVTRTGYLVLRIGHRKEVDRKGRP